MALHVAWASPEHGSSRTVGVLTRWPKAPKVSVLTYRLLLSNITLINLIFLKSQKKKVSVQGTRQKLHCLLPPSLEWFHFCHSLLVESVISLPRSQRKGTKTPPSVEE